MREQEVYGLFLLEDILSHSVVFSVQINTCWEEILKVHPLYKLRICFS